ncbi:MAG: translation initiation factor IF-2 [Pirellulaceae bacterium]
MPVFGAYGAAGTDEKRRAPLPIRIYALAKELKIDSKDLVDICLNAGITGKGSALASLDDDEVTKVKQHLSGGSGEKVRPNRVVAAEPIKDVAYTRQEYSGPVRDTKIKVIPKKRTPLDALGPLARESGDESEIDESEIDESEIDESVVDESVVDESVVDVGAELEEVAESPAIVEEAPLATEVLPTQEDVGVAAVAEAGLVDSQPVTGEARASDVPFDAPIRPNPAPLPNPIQKKTKAKPKKREPIIKVRLADMPEVKQPTVKPKAIEPTPQKPEIRLPQDAIRKARTGATRAPLEQHIAKTESTARNVGKPPAGKSAGRGPAVPAEPGAAAAANRGDKGRRGKGASVGLVGMADVRQERSKQQQQPRRKNNRRNFGQDDDGRGGRSYNRKRALRRVGTNTAAPRKNKVAVELPCTVRSFSEASGVSAGEVIRVLIGMGQMKRINDPLEAEFVELVAAELGLDLEFKQAETLEDSLISKIDNWEVDPEKLVARPPVVTFLGHVDHGKTSLLDRLIGIDVVSGEAGGITQHIRAYQVATKDGRAVAFVDTPGHEAFTEMRARGANVTDIAVIVIAADDGIMPQTEEAISHAKAAGVPIVVAMNKMDLPGADANRVMQQMTQYELVPSEWGGDIEVVPTSAISGDGMDELLETLLTIAELNEYQADPVRPASGVCLEAEQEGGRGVVAKFLVKNGSLKVGDVVVCGKSYGRVKAMFDTLATRKRVKKAGPSMPVNITGLTSPPGAGDTFHVLEDIADARRIAESRADVTRSEELSETTTAVSLDEFQRMLAEGKLGKGDEVSMLNLIIRADVRGSIEAIQKELGKLAHPEVQVKILHASVGAITVGDVTLADASHAVIVGFNVIPDDGARSLADERNIEIRRYNIIYKLTEDIKMMLEGKLKPEERIIEMGHALVKQVFSVGRIGTVAGCYVARGTIERGCRIRVNRDGRTIGDYQLDSLRRIKDDVREVQRGMECGIRLVGFNDIKQDDLLEAYRVEEVARTL